VSNRTKLGGVLLVVVGVMIGATVFSHMNSSTRPEAVGAPEPAGEQATAAATDRPLRSLHDLSQAFVDVAKESTPTVVTVFTERVMKVPQGWAGSPFEDFFSEFFGSPRRGQPEEREYRQTGLGSGVVVSADGYIITNNHVIREADSVFVRFSDERTLAARLIGSDPKTDIAVLKVEAKELPAMPFGNSDELEVGEWVLAIGSPLSPNLAHTVTQGIVSAKGRSNVGLAEYEDFIQTDAAINPGNSGGALINLNGELVGINAAIASRTGGYQGIGFAVPINMARQVMTSIIEHGTVVRGWLGVYIQNVDETMAKAMDLPSAEGVLVSDLSEGGPAEKAGIKPEDVVLKVGGKKIADTIRFRNEIASMAPGKKVDLEILRDGKKRTITVELGTLDAAEAGAGGSEQLADVLGFQVAPFDENAAERYGLKSSLEGVVVIDIDPASQAARVGLNVGDLIVGVNKQRIRNQAEFAQVLGNAKKGETVLLRIMRQDRGLYVAFTL
jgi:serine protease Do